MRRRDQRPPWRIQHELLWARIFAFLAGPGRHPSDRYELNDDLADLYFELAAARRTSGLLEQSLAAEHRAHEYELRGTPPEPRPAAALAMPAPHPYTRTDAYGKVVPPDPEDAS